MKKVLTIAGSYSGGACGIQADIKTFSALGVYSASVITAVTAQNSIQMADVLEVPTDMVIKQTRMVLEDIEPEAVKVSMIGRAENYTALKDIFQEFEVEHLVVDHEINCYRGCPWVLWKEAIFSMKQYMLPVTEVFAPSIPDAEVILARQIDSVPEMEGAAKALKSYVPKWVILKGGHLEGEPEDVLWNGSSMIHFSGKRVQTNNDNGSGCNFSSAVATFLALGDDPVKAMRRAKSYMEEALRHNIQAGKGRGTVYQFYSFRSTASAH